MILKANLNDVLSLIEKKSSFEEVKMEVSQLKSVMSKNHKEFKTSIEEQTSLNEVLCAENCVARWLWKNGQVTSRAAGGGGGQSLV